MPHINNPRRVQLLPWVANCHPHKRKAKGRCVYHWPSRRWSLLNWKGQHLKPEARREKEERREGRRRQTFTPLDLKQHFLTLLLYKCGQALVSRYSPWVALLLYTECIQGQKTSDCQSVYRSNCVSVYNSFSLVGGMQCHLGKSLYGLEIASLTLYFS